MSGHKTKAHSQPSAPGCDDPSANMQRHRFFMQVPGINAVAKQLDVPSTFLIGLASYESGWLDDHNYELNNLWGLTKAGGNNLSFPSVEAGNTYFASRVGPYIKGTSTMVAFFAGLQKEGYNSANPNYFSMDPKKGMLFNRIQNISKWESACGVSL